MKRIAILLVAVFGALPYPATHAAESVKTIHRADARDRADDGRYFARSTKGGFSVKLPVPFHDYTQTTAATESGDKVLHIIAGKNLDGFAFTAMALERTALIPDSDVRASLQSIAADEGLDPVITSEIKSGVEMFSTHLVQRPQSAYMLATKTIDRYFHVMCRYPVEKAVLASRTCSDFLSSFKIE